jgi:hypothetical protein
VFSVWSVPRRYKHDRLVRNQLVSESLRELLLFSRCELLLLEAGSGRTGIVRELRGRAVRSRYQATASEDCNRLRILVCVCQRFVKCSHE